MPAPEQMRHVCASVPRWQARRLSGSRADGWAVGVGRSSDFGRLQFVTSGGWIPSGSSRTPHRFLGVAEMSQRSPRAGRWPQRTSPPAVGGLAPPPGPRRPQCTRPAYREAASSSWVCKARARSLPGHTALLPLAPLLLLRGRSKGSECAFPRSCLGIRGFAPDPGAEVRMALGSVTFLGVPSSGACPPVGSRKLHAGSHPVVSVRLRWTGRPGSPVQREPLRPDVLTLPRPAARPSRPHCPTAQSLPTVHGPAHLKCLLLPDIRAAWWPDIVSLV